MDTESEQLRKIFVGGLNWETTEEKLHDYFLRWGNIVDCVIMRKDGRSRGFGFVTFDKAKCVDDILKSETKFELDDREIEPKRSVPRDETNNPTALSKTKKIFVGGLPSKATENDIHEYFASLCDKFGNGKVVDIDLKKDRLHVDRLRGFAFVTFDDEDVVEKVCAMRYHEIKTKSCEVKKAESQAVIRKRQEKDDIARGVTRERHDHRDHSNSSNNMRNNMGGNGFMGNWGPGFFGSGMGGGFGGESSRGGSNSEGRSGGGNFNPFMGFGPTGYGAFGPGFGGFPGFGFGGMGGMGFGNFGGGGGGFGFGGFGPGGFGSQAGFGGSGAGGGGGSSGTTGDRGSGSKSGYSNGGSSSRAGGLYGSAKSPSVNDRSSVLGGASQAGASRESATGYEGTDTSNTNYGYGALAGATGGFGGATTAADWSNFNPAMFGYAAALNASPGGDAAKAYGTASTASTAAADYATQMGNYLNQINSSYGPANRANSRSLGSTDAKTGVRAYRPY